MGKIARPFLRKLNGEDEIAELKVIAYAPLVDSSSPCISPKPSRAFPALAAAAWKAKEGLRPTG